MGQKRYRWRWGGYTLLELMLGLSLVGVLVSLGYQGVSLLEAQAEQQFMRQFTQSIRLAKLAALSHQQQARVCGSDDQRSCSPYAVWDRYWIVVLEGGKVLASYPVLKGARIEFHPFHPGRGHALRIDPNGMSYNNGTFTYTYDYQGQSRSRPLVTNNAVRLY